MNYTTYDVRRDRDTVNPNTHPYVMLQSPEVGTSAHPYWYAQVLGIFHTNVSTNHPAAPINSAQRISSPYDFSKTIVENVKENGEKTQGARENPF